MERFSKRLKAQEKRGKRSGERSKLHRMVRLTRLAGNFDIFSTGTPRAANERAVKRNERGAGWARAQVHCIGKFNSVVYK